MPKTKLVWDEIGSRYYETGVRHGVLYPVGSGAASGTYPEGVAWNGLISISESPSGAEANPIYADDIKYLNLYSAEDLGLTIEAYTYPDEFGECDGTAEPATGLIISQQTRKAFGLAFRTTIGNDTEGNDYGYKLHLIYGCMASPSEKAYSTINESPEAITFSWEVTTTPVEVNNYKPTARLVIDSTKADPDKLSKLEAVLYGVDAPDFSASNTYAVGDYVTYENAVYRCKTTITTAAAWDATKWDEVEDVGPRLPLPNEVISILS